MVLPYKRCWHHIPADLALQLPHRSVCPSCTVERHIRGARRINSDFANRDGIFQSKATGRKENEAIGSPSSREWRKHRKLVERWRRARVEMRKDVSRFEELVDGEPFKDCAECTKLLREALSMYEQWAMHEHEPPGCSRGIDRGDDGKTTVDQSPPALEPSPAELLARSSSSSVNSRKSCLRKTAAASDKDQTPPQSPKNVVIEENTVVFPSPSEPDEADWALNEEVAREAHRRPHNAHTSRETARPKKAISRSLPGYARGSWASPEGYDKVETSFMKTPWADIKAIWGGSEPDETDGDSVGGADEGKMGRIEDLSVILASEQKAIEKQEPEAPKMQPCRMTSWSWRICKQSWGILKQL